MRAFLGVPVLVRGEVFGNLYMTEKRARRVHRRGRGPCSPRWPPRPASPSTTPASTRRARPAPGVAAGRRRRAGACCSRRRRGDGACAASASAMRDAHRRRRGLAAASGSERRRPVRTRCGAQSGDGPARPHRQSDCDRGGRPLLQPVGGRRRRHASTWPGSATRAALRTWTGGPCASRCPLTGSTDVRAVRRRRAAARAAAPPFDADVDPLVTAFADQAPLALDMAARQRVARQLDVYEDRDRIARDLHDHVIQRVFAAGLALQAVLPAGAATHRRRHRMHERGRPARRHGAGHPDDDLRPAHHRRRRLRRQPAAAGARHRHRDRRRGAAAHRAHVRRRRQPGHRRPRRRRRGGRAGGRQQRRPALRRRARHGHPRRRRRRGRGGRRRRPRDRRDGRPQRPAQPGQRARRRRGGEASVAAVARRRHPAALVGPAAGRPRPCAAAQPWGVAAAPWRGPRPGCGAPAPACASRCDT